MLDLQPKIASWLLVTRLRVYLILTLTFESIKEAAKAATTKATTKQTLDPKVTHTKNKEARLQDKGTANAESHVEKK